MILYRAVALLDTGAILMLAAGNTRVGRASSVTVRSVVRWLNCLHAFVFANFVRVVGNCMQRLTRRRIEAHETKPCLTSHVCTCISFVMDPYLLLYKLPVDTRNQINLRSPTARNSLNQAHDAI